MSFHNCLRFCEAIRGSAKLLEAPALAGIRNAVVGSETKLPGSGGPERCCRGSARLGPGSETVLPGPFKNTLEDL